ncbi:tRNA (guanine-N(7)-)-methyltransferase non-catalytic subunit wdr4-like [Actinia tenebrosa]|uniref:tRNA (guanine-N(7)-)-methyltransferase non-catalytic subunit n=1 Tax=Actinia tenebrosa TaxID=6105 RepID=A0A6P8HWW3_ACTTE|nr:tRNA (guanine-N(7)-)-methyltransferase non-catalytic subunit wdr4-like [Actinia tenebrosa]
MASLVFSNNSLLALISCSKFRILDCNDGSCKFSCELSSIKPNTDSKTTKPDTSDAKQDPALGHGNIGCFSSSGRYFSLCMTNKTVTLWETDTWKCLSTRSLEKKATAILFTKDENYIVVADKTGDVYKFSTNDVHSEGILLLGHISMIMDMAFSNADKFIITAERDEKIKVTHFPNCHNIEAYCLGHTDFVSSIGVIKSEDDEILVSGSGDGCVMFWDFKSGKRLHTECLNEQKEEEGKEIQDDKVIVSVSCCPKNNVVCVMTESSCLLHLYHVSNDNNLKVTKLPTVTTSVPPWNITFDSNGLLWCLQPMKSEPLMVFHPEGAVQHIKYVKLEQFEDLPVYSTASDWTYLEECVGKEKQLSALRRKKDMDNLKEYLTKKEERIRQKKARLGGLDVEECDAKRIKE